MSAAEPLASLTRDIVDTIADRPRESPARRAARAQNALALIEALAPANGVEMMLAGQIVLFMALALDAAADSGRADTEEAAFKYRRQALEMGRLQMACLKELRRGRAEVAEPAGDGLAADGLTGGGLTGGGLTGGGLTGGGLTGGGPTGDAPAVKTCSAPVQGKPAARPEPLPRLAIARPAVPEAEAMGRGLPGLPRGGLYRHA